MVSCSAFLSPQAMVESRSSWTEETPLAGCIPTFPQTKPNVLIYLCPEPHLKPAAVHELFLHFSLPGQYTTHLSLNQALPTYCHPYPTCTQMFIIALFIRVKIGNSPNVHQLVSW